MTAFEHLPQTINACGVEIPINTDFRASIAFEQMLQHAGTENDGWIEEMLRIYFLESSLSLIGTIVQHGSVDELFSAVMDFYRCGQQAPKREKKSVPVSYSFSHDEKRIYAAFYEQYHIDLFSLDYLHWWKFSAMFLALNDDTEMVKIMRIRTAEPDKHMTAKERAALRKAKAAYAIPDNRSQEQKDADFADGFASMF